MQRRRCGRWTASSLFGISVWSPKTVARAYRFVAVGVPAGGRGVPRFVGLGRRECRFIVTCRRSFSR